MIKRNHQSSQEEGLLMNTPLLREMRADTRREDVLNAIAWRFDPSLSVYHQLEEMLTEVEVELHKAVIQSPDFTTFRQVLNQILTTNSTTEAIA